MTYKVYRNGFNAANHSSVGERSADCLIGQYDANSEEEAIAQMVANGVSCYSGQYFHAVTADDEQQAEQAKGKWRVEYWIGTTAITEHCDTAEEVRECLDCHQNAYPPHVYETATGDEVDASEFYDDDDD